MGVLDNLKPNEKRLVLVAIAAVVLFTVFQLVGGEGTAMEDEVALADVDALQAQFEDYRSQLERASEIVAEYDQLEARLPRSTEDRRPDLAFSDQLAQLCTDAGFPYPSIDPTRITSIPDVDDYELLSANLKIENTSKDVSRLLRVLHNNGLIIRELEMRGTLDNDFVKARINVSRIAPVPDQANSRRNRRSRGF